jgi:hypothetical protein
MAVSPPAETPPPPRLGAAAYVIGGLSFIPLIGLVFGVIAIAWGIATRKAGRRTFMLLGGGGIIVTIVLYGGLFYFGFAERGGIYDRLRAQLAQSELNTLVPAIEYYKVQHGSYPDSLEELKASLPQNSFVTVFDPRDVRWTGAPRYFFYQRVGSDHYYLRGVGPNGRPFASDDIVPQIAIPSGSGIGLLLAPPAAGAPANP